MPQYFKTTAGLVIVIPHYRRGFWFVVNQLGYIGFIKDVAYQMQSRGYTDMISREDMDEAWIDTLEKLFPQFLEAKSKKSTEMKVMLLETGMQQKDTVKVHEYWRKKAREAREQSLPVLDTTDTANNPSPYLLNFQAQAPVSQTFGFFDLQELIKEDEDLAMMDIDGESEDDDDEEEEDEEFFRDGEEIGGDDETGGGGEISGGGDVMTGVENAAGGEEAAGRAMMAELDNVAKGIKRKREEGEETPAAAPMLKMVMPMRGAKKAKRD